MIFFFQIISQKSTGEKMHVKTLFLIILYLVQSKLHTIKKVR